MSNVAIIFAGGAGQRMNTKTKPKQFLELHGKPILIYTLEHFQQCKEIDGIVLVMLESWIPYTEELLDRYRITKVKSLIPGGDSGQASIFNGIAKAVQLYPEDSVVLIHDGVRPLIDEQTIKDCIECANKNGNAITVSPAIETIALLNKEDSVGKILPRSKCQMVKAPQCFKLRDIMAAHLRSQKERLQDFIDSASLMQHYGMKLFTIIGPPENIKITTPSDFYVFRAIVDARENSQIFGV